MRKKKVDPELVAYLERHPDVLERGTPNQKDRSIPCPAKKCGAERGRPCKGLPRGTVHFARRISRILQGVR